MTVRLRLFATGVAALLAVAARAENVSPRDIWPQAATAALAGDVNTAIRKTNELVATGRSYGVNSYPLYASAAAALARQAEKLGKPDTASWADKAAEQLDARSAAVAFSNADRARDRGNWRAALPAAGRGFSRLPARMRTRLLSECDMLIAITLAAALTTALFALALFIRYGRSAAHDFREIVGQRVHGGAVTVLAFALLFLPLFFWMGPVWLALYWFVIFFSYANLIERIAICVLALVLASLPIVADRAATQMAGVDSPVMMAAISTTEQSYQPMALRRLQELAAIVPDDDTIQILLGNLELQDGNDKQAEVNYRRAMTLRDSAGAHVNLGNLNFLDNDFAAAVTEYDKAAQLDPRLAIAMYNSSVASGETYKFDEQGQKLEKAKAIDRAYVERLAQNPPPQKIVIYSPPLDQCWAVTQKVALRSNARAIFGTYPYFDPGASAANPLTLGSVAAVLLAVGVWATRRKTGFANSCIKCGRTFCPRCKSARESATYCTQCIHIYLKRDGVSLDTKRSKLDEVHRHHSGILLRNRLFATFLPGSAQLMEGSVLVGIAGTFAFLLFLAVLLLTGRLAPAIGPVAETAKLLVRSAAGLLAVITWFLLTVPVYRRKAAA